MRVVRINELIRQELSSILHTRFRDSAVRITISGVETAPNLHTATVYYSVIGAQADAAAARRFFAKNGEELRLLLAKRVIIKYLPHLTFIYDESLERGSHLNDVIDSLGMEGEYDPETPASPGPEED